MGEGTLFEKMFYLYRNDLVLKIVSLFINLLAPKSLISRGFEFEEARKKAYN